MITSRLLLIILPLVQCNGKKPCNTCTKRQLLCEYKTPGLESSDQDFVASPTKRRHLDSSPRPLRSSLDDTLTSRPPSVPWGPVGAAAGPKPEPSGSLVAINPTKSVRYLLNADETDSDSRSKMSNASGMADEAEVYESQWRMLQDSTGRLRKCSRTPTPNAFMLPVLSLVVARRCPLVPETALARS